MTENGKSGEKERGSPIAAEEYLAHIALAYAASPADSPEESVAKALLEVACSRLGAVPQDVVNEVLRKVPGGRLLPPWGAGTGVPTGLRLVEEG